MIPTIEQIIEDLMAGTINKSLAIVWLHAHAEGAANDLRDHFAGLAMQAMTSDIKRVISLCDEAKRQKHSYAEEVALQSYVLSDEMLKERSARSERKGAQSV
jgi:hypothetical protein